MGDIANLNSAWIYRTSPKSLHDLLSSGGDVHSVRVNDLTFVAVRNVGLKTISVLRVIDDVRTVAHPAYGSQRLVIGGIDQIFNIQINLRDKSRVRCRHGRSYADRVDRRVIRFYRRGKH